MQETRQVPEKTGDRASAQHDRSRNRAYQATDDVRRHGLFDKVAGLIYQLLK